MSESGSEPTVAAREDLRGALPAGVRLRGYEILAVLGHGGFGVTYRARDTTLGRDVAIKEYLPTSVAVREDGTTVLPRSTNLAEEFHWGRDRFLEEARILAKLDGAPAIVRVFDFLEANGTAYMVMALLDGESLERRLKRDGPLSQAAIESILYPLLDGLEAVHATGFLHRDIKPDNIMLDARGAPTLIDFGASRAAMAGRTTAMTAIFTPGYAAAEQFTSAKQGPWTDIYGLCATLYHAIIGRPPPSAFDRMVNDTYEPLAKLSPAGFSSRLLAAIDAGLDDGGQRPAAIDRRLAHDARLGLRRPPGPPRRPARRRRAASVCWIGVAAAAILVLAGGGYYFATSQPSRSGGRWRSGRERRESRAGAGRVGEVARGSRAARAKRRTGGSTASARPKRRSGARSPTEDSRAEAPRGGGQAEGRRPRLRPKRKAEEDERKVGRSGRSGAAIGEGRPPAYPGCAGRPGVRPVA